MKIIVVDSEISGASVAYHLVVCGEKARVMTGGRSGCIATPALLVGKGMQDLIICRSSP
jgi:hypothetical protein